VRLPIPHHRSLHPLGLLEDMISISAFVDYIGLTCLLLSGFEA
jgi:hypothetical protein